MEKPTLDWFRLFFVFVRKMWRLQYPLALWYILNIHMEILVEIPLNLIQITHNYLWCIDIQENISIGVLYRRLGIPNSSTSPKSSVSLLFLYFYDSIPMYGSFLFICLSLLFFINFSVSTLATWCYVVTWQLVNLVWVIRKYILTTMVEF